MIAKRIIFIGTVQGVGFRFTVNRTARRFSLVGYVRNLPDGSVEMLAQGNSNDIDNCVQDIEESFAGYIRDKRIEDLPPDSSYKDFRITF
jgi:acylphosphatase